MVTPLSLLLFAGGDTKDVHPESPRFDVNCLTLFSSTLTFEKVYLPSFA